MKRAYSLLTIKAVDEDKRIITGIATTPTPDRVGDIVEPKGAEFDLPIPFLWQHDSGQPIGHVTKAKVTAAGIEVTCEVVKIEEPGKLKDRVDEAWQSLNAGLVRGLSIGFKELEYSRLDDGSYGYRFLRWLWLELSAVTIPANGDCSIQTIKSLDTAMRAASGHTQRGVVRLTPPASGKSNTITKPQEGKNVKISEKIQRYEEKRAANIARMKAIHEETDESLTKEQREEFDTLDAEVSTIDSELPSLKKIEGTLAKTAKPVIVEDPDQPGKSLTSTPGISVKQAPKLLPGIAFAQLAKVKMAAQITGHPLIHVARGMYGENSQAFGIVSKANEVAPGTTLSGNWAADLVSLEGGAVADFLEFLRPQTIVGKFGVGNVPALRRLDFYVPYVLQTGGGSAYWVGEGKPKPLTNFDFDRSTLTPTKIANICVLTEENIKFSSPNSDMIVRDQLAEAIAAGIDIAFVDPANAGSAGVKPAAITNGADSIAAEGTGDADDIRKDIKSMISKFVVASNMAGTGVIIMSQTNAVGLAMLVNALGQPEFPGVTKDGGVLFGYPLVVSQAIGNVIVMVDASQIYLGDDGGVDVAISREASLEMKSSGLTMDGTAPGTGAALVSMFQSNMVAIRAERMISWKRARATAVTYLTGTQWGGPVNT